MLLLSPWMVFSYAPCNVLAHSMVGSRTAAGNSLQRQRYQSCRPVAGEPSAGVLVLGGLLLRARQVEKRAHALVAHEGGKHIPYAGELDAVTEVFCPWNNTLHPADR